jgi:endonuclease/exonuclease/phosphatase (EEP) superfamily protein YafD
MARTGITIVTVNARQTGRDMDEGRLERLAEALVSRGGRGAEREAGRGPDVIVVNEMYPKQVEGFVSHLNAATERQHDGSPGGFAAASSSPVGRAKVFVDVNAIEVLETSMWNDVCDPKARFQIASLKSRTSDRPLTVAGIHLSPHYERPGECRRANIAELLRLTSGVDGPVVVAGDFNKRAMETDRECDPDEASAMLAWWKDVTTGPRKLVDTVRRSQERSLADQWTHEAPSDSELCDGSTGRKRSRIDFIFASEELEIVSAGVDPEPHGGYSDHRFVSAMLSMA